MKLLGLRDVLARARPLVIIMESLTFLEVCIVTFMQSTGIVLEIVFLSFYQTESYILPYLGLFGS
jgi:hypothetical protein